MGLLIDSVVWHGLAIDKDFQIWQTGEEPVSILMMPYQNLKRATAHDGSKGQDKGRVEQEYEHQDGRPQ